MGATKYLDHQALTNLLNEKKENHKLNRENNKSLRKGRWNQKDATIEWETTSFMSTNQSASTTASVFLNKERTFSPEHNFNRRKPRVPKVKQLNKKGKLSLFAI